MKRRESSSGDSFDLFLDTVCNAFGGIVFIAILVAILVQTRSVAESLQKQLPYDMTTTLSDEELAIELDRQKLKRNRLEELLAELTDSSAPEEPDVALNPAVERNPSDEINELEPKLQTTLADLAKFTAANKQLEVAVRNLEKLRREMEKAAEEEVPDETNENNDLVTFEVPKFRSSSKGTYTVLLHGDAVYFAGYASGLNENVFNGEDVSVRKSLDGESFWARPSPTAVGKNVNSSAVRSLLTRLDLRGEFMTMIVWDDSYETFQRLKNQILEKGLGYRAWIVPPGDDEMSLGFTNQDATIQ